MNKIIKTIIAIATAMTALAVFAHETNNPQIEMQDSLLWKITGNELVEPSYLYGTMHLVCRNDGTEKAKVQKAINNSSQLYLEMDMDDPKMFQEMMMFLNNGIKIKDIENLEKKNKLLSLASKHLDMKSSIIEQTDLFSLFSILTFKSVTQCSMPSSVEQALINVFKSDKKSIEGLETIAEQMGFLMDSGVAELDSLIQVLEEFDDMKEMYAKMTVKYFNEDVDGLYSMMTTASDLYSDEYLQKMMSTLVDQRNINWVTIMPKIAQESSTFFAVGVGHLGGENGVIQLLKNEGFKVEAVTD